MLPSLFLLLVCQAAGEAAARLLHLPLPGPVIGLALLLACLLLRGRRGVPEPLGETADGLLRHLSLLFVPAGVGITNYLGLIADQALPVAAAVVGSTVLTIWVTGLVTSRVDAMLTARHGSGSGGAAGSDAR
ncbi:MAG TPA: CidA/LrgA family protein [Stellaceae bacterium]|jgi:putative effector of murein hydrolase LrgA (UPF0299 family)